MYVYNCIQTQARERDMNAHTHTFRTFTITRRGPTKF